MGRQTKFFVISSLGIALSAGLILWLGSALKLAGTNLLIFRIGMGIIMILVLAIVMWLMDRAGKLGTKQKKKQGGGGAAAAGAGDGEEIDRLVKAANARLTSSGVAGGKAQLDSLPAIVFLGPSGSIKTTSIVHCGLDPELLAGQVYQGDAIAPTSEVNLWYTRGTVFVEAAGKLAGDESAWTRLVRKLQPGRFGAALGRGGQAPRVAVVCFDCEEFAKQGAGDATGSMARQIRQRLGELAKTLGSQVPVYVLFTKADRIPFFSEYVQNFTADEAVQVFGVTLPFTPETSEGVYAERETRRLSEVFHELFLSLADKRLQFLPREHRQENVPGVYEFPREFRKLRSLVVPFLVEVCKPSELQVSPLLRGFYFSGVRAVIVQEPTVQMRQETRREGEKLSLEATSIFNPRQQATQQEGGGGYAAAPRTQKVPQWMFLSRLFSDVITADQAAMSASGGGVKVNKLRRLLLASAALLFLICSVAFTVSFFGNRNLQSNIRDAATAISVPPGGAGVAALPSIDSLRRLEALREQLATLIDYERNGVPWRLRWGLYSNLYPLARATYFDAFRRLMFGEAQNAVYANLQSLPATPGPTGEYSPAYNRLRAYLITTLYPHKSQADVLSPVLMADWLKGRKLDDQRDTLARTQFDFYATELLAGNPYDLKADSDTVARTRQYLNSFAGIERIYQILLNEAGKKTKPVQFNRMFPGSIKTVVNNYEVPGAFTKDGWKFMEDFLKNVDKYVGGDIWVLCGESPMEPGKACPSAQVSPELLAQLRARYQKDYIEHWRAYIRAGRVQRYSDIKDATEKLLDMTGNQTPLMAMLSLCAKNTDVTSEVNPDSAKAVKEAFQPVARVMPPESGDVLIVKENRDYVTSLQSLQSSLEQVPNNPGSGDPAVSTARNMATNATGVTRSIALDFRPDREGKMDSAVSAFLQAPILYVDPFLRNVDVAVLNRGGAAFCGPYKALMAKYPFNPTSNTEASLAEFNDMFAPGTGKMWQFLQDPLSKVLEERNGVYAPKANIDVTVNPSFLRFLNNMVQLSKGVYPQQGGNPSLSYTLRPVLIDPVIAATLSIDGSTAKFAGSGGKPANFIWPGSGVAKVSGSMGGPELDLLSYRGTWAVFRLFHEAENWRSTGNTYAGEWALYTGGKKDQPVMVNGRQVKVPFEINLGSAPPVFQKGYFTGLVCQPVVASAK